MGDDMKVRGRHGKARAEKQAGTVSDARMQDVSTLGRERWGAWDCFRAPRGAGAQAHGEMAGPTCALPPSCHLARAQGRAAYPAIPTAPGFPYQPLPSHQEGGFAPPQQQQQQQAYAYPGQDQGAPAAGVPVFQPPPVITVVQRSNLPPPARVICASCGQEVTPFE